MLDGPVFVNMVDPMGNLIVVHVVICEGPHLSCVDQLSHIIASAFSKSLYSLRINIKTFISSNFANSLNYLSWTWFVESQIIAVVFQCLKLL